MTPTKKTRLIVVSSIVAGILLLIVVTFFWAWISAGGETKAAQQALTKLVELRAGRATMAEAKNAFAALPEQSRSLRCVQDSCQLVLSFDNVRLSELRLARRTVLAITMRFEADKLKSTSIIYEIAPVPRGVVYITDGGCVSCVQSNKAYYRSRSGRGVTIIDLTPETPYELRKKSLDLNTYLLSSFTRLGDSVDLIPSE